MSTTILCLLSQLQTVKFYILSLVLPGEIPNVPEGGVVVLH